MAKGGDPSNRSLLSGVPEHSNTLLSPSAESLVGGIPPIQSPHFPDDLELDQLPMNEDQDEDDEEENEALGLEEKNEDIEEAPLELDDEDDPEAILNSPDNELLRELMGNPENLEEGASSNANPGYSTVRISQSTSPTMLRLTRSGSMTSGNLMSYNGNGYSSRNGNTATSGAESGATFLNAAKSGHIKSKRASISQLRCAVFNCSSARIGKAFCAEHFSQKMQIPGEKLDGDAGNSSSMSSLEKLKFLMLQLREFLGRKNEADLLLRCASWCDESYNDVFMSVDDPSVPDPISDVGIVLIGKDKDKNVAPDGYQIADRTHSGKPLEVNKLSNGKSMYFAIKRDKNSVPVTCFSLSFESKSEEPPLGFTKVSLTLDGESADLNYKTNAEETYLSFRKDGFCPISNLVFVMPKYKEHLPHGYHRLAKTPGGRIADLNLGTEVSELFMCFQFDIKSMLTPLKNDFENSKSERRPYIAAIAVLCACLYSPNEDVLKYTLNIIRKIEIQGRCPLPKTALNLIIKALCDLQAVTQHSFKREVQIANFNTIRDVVNMRLLDVQSDTIMHVFKTCALARHDDRKEHTLSGMIDFITSLRKELNLRKTLKNSNSQNGNSSLNSSASSNNPLPDAIVRRYFDLSSSESEVSAGSILGDLISHVHTIKTLDPLLSAYQRHRVVSSAFIIDMANLIDVLFSQPIDRLNAAILVMTSKLSAEFISLRVSQSISETVKRKVHAVKALERFLINSGTFIKTNPSIGIILRRCMFPSLLESYVTFIPQLIQPLLRVLLILWRYFSSVCKMEFCYLLDFIFSIISSKYCLADQKIELLEGISRLFANPEDIVDFYYNFDNQYYEWSMFERYVDLCSQLAKGEKMNPLDQSVLDLQISALSSIVNVMELVSRYVLRKAGILKQRGLLQNISRSLLHDSLDKSQMERSLSVKHHLQKLNTVDNSIPEDDSDDDSGIIMEKIKSRENVKKGRDDSKSNDTSRSLSRTKRFVRKSTWIERFDDQEKLDELFRDSETLARNKGLKHAVKYLLDGRHVGLEDICKWFKESTVLDRKEIGDFLSSDFNNQFSLEFFIDLRKTYLSQFDYTSTSFDQALRLFLCSSGFRLPGEAQKIERLIESFADKFCLDNPSIFESSEVAFVVSYSLLILNTAMNNPRAQVKRSLAPMSLEEYIRSVRSTGGGGSLSDNFIKSLYQGIKENPIEWQDDEYHKKAVKDAGTFEEQALTIEKGFLREAEMALSRNLALIRKETFFRRKFYHTKSKKIVYGLMHVSWAQFLASITALISKTRAADVIAICLDGLRYGLCCCILLQLDAEADGFARILARIAYYESFSGTNEELQRAYAKGKHLEVSWYTNLSRESNLNPKAICKKVNFIANETKCKILYERDQNLLKEIEEKFGGELKLLDPERRFIREGDLLKIGANGKNKEYHVFLFNNLVIYATPAGFSRKYKVHRVIHLSLCRIRDLKDLEAKIGFGTGYKHAFRLENPQKPVTFQCESSLEKNSWMGDLKRSIEGTLARQKKWIEEDENKFFEPSRSVSRAPSSGPGSGGHTGPLSATGESSSNLAKSLTDASLSKYLGKTGSSTCKLCIKPFGTFQRRKFTCPHCVQVVCGDCSSKSSDLPLKQGQIVTRSTRVCDACHGILTGAVKLDAPVVIIDS